MRPEIHFDYLEPRTDWVGKSFEQLYEEMDELRKKIKEAAGYKYDNSHFYINNCYGMSALTLSFSKECITFWNARNNRGIGSFYKSTGKEKILSAIVGSAIFAVDVVFTEEMAKIIDDWCKKIFEELTMCNECHEWKETYICYSYAGAVCGLCYNPDIHRLPDTRGD